MKCETCDREYDPVCVHAKALTEEIMGYGGHESITDEIIFPMCCKHMRNLMNVGKEEMFGFECPECHKIFYTDNPGKDRCPECGKHVLSSNAAAKRWGK